MDVDCNGVRESESVWYRIKPSSPSISVLCDMFLKIHWVYLHVAIKLNFIFCRGLHSSFC